MSQELEERVPVGLPWNLPVSNVNAVCFLAPVLSGHLTGQS